MDGQTRKIQKDALTFTQRGVDGRRDQRDEGFQVKAASSGLCFQQPVALLQVDDVRLLHCRMRSDMVYQHGDRPTGAFN